MTLESLAAEIEAIRGRLPDQDHAMVDVGYHFANLWFSGQHENWKLAEFNLAETKSHLRWAVRIIPKRKVGEQEIDLHAILQSLENAPLAQLAEAIASQDKAAFEKPTGSRSNRAIPATRPRTKPSSDRRFRRTSTC